MSADGASGNRKAILKAAEQLFAEKGFDATSVNSIAKAASVNKAMIYYYFQNKDDLILSLFTDMLAEMEEGGGKQVVPRDDIDAIAKEIGQEIEFLDQHQRILALIVMEAMKLGKGDDFLFQISDRIIRKELDLRGFAKADSSTAARKHTEKALVHEFFTGVMPVFAFVLLRDKFCEYFNCEGAQIDEYFLQAFKASHLNSHLDAQPE